ncbi:MAG: DegT/DnrJ/EryC1/StrS family aminotransferase [Candidatus Kerfeldbacteria bacterium]|jgi:dTDP-4-amino-4,6-dideoxygalactose transaminase
MRKDFLIFGSPKIGQDEINEVVDSLRSGWISTGPKVAKFENNFKKFIGARYVVALNSCTAGLHLSLITAGVKRDDEIITTPMTFAATANTILHVGAKPVFIDVKRDTMNIDVSKIEKKITRKTKAIMPVHMAGRPCDMDKIMKIAKRHKLVVIEDAAHAIGASYKGKKIGTIGDYTVFSFYVTKNLVTGEGGMVASKDKDIINRIQTYALHGMSKGAWKRYSDKGYKHYQVVNPGYKYTMMDIQAAIGIHQLKKFNKYQKRRKEVWNKYNKEFKNLPIITPADPEKRTIHARHLYTIMLELNKLSIDRDRFVEELYKRNIGTGVHFIAVHLHPYYKKTFGYKRGAFPNAEWISDRTLSLPLSAKLSNKDVKDVIQVVKEVCNLFQK